jgi:hypothetical protein
MACSLFYFAGVGFMRAGVAYWGSSICKYVKSFFLAQNSLEVHLNFFQKLTWYLHEILLCMMKMRL